MAGSGLTTPGPFHPSPNTDAIGDSGHKIQIEHLANRGVVVRVIYPDDRRQKDIFILRTICVVICLVLTVAWLFFRIGTAGWSAVIGVSILAIYILINSFRQFSAIARSYTFRADSSGLTVEIVAGRDQKSQYFTRGQMADIVLGFSHYSGNNSLFKCWLVIVASDSSEICCLQNLGGDHLGRIANALRAALGMPARTWP